MKDEQNDVTRLKPREEPKVKEWIAEMKAAFADAGGIDLWRRMEHNREARFALWDGQSWSGKKHAGVDQDPLDVFPWEGAADNRVQVIDEIIEERVGIKMVAAKRAEQRVIPRNLNPDEEKGRSAASWSLVSDYYDDIAGDPQRVELKRWTDRAEEFGHSIMFLHWRERNQLEKRTLSKPDVVGMAQTAALGLASRRVMEEMQEAGEEVPTDDQGQPQALSTEQAAQIMAAVETDIEEMLHEPELRDELIAQLLAMDPDMTEEEARHVSKRIKTGEPVEYYAPYVVESCPKWRALMPWVDVFYPVMTTDLRDARWIAVTEWVDAVTLRERVGSESYNEKWVKKVEEQPGVAFDLTELSQAPAWLMNGAGIGTGVKIAPDGEAYGGNNVAEEERREMFQIVHLYYRATTQSGVPGLYRTVLHGQVDDLAALHECQEDAHGEYPFVAQLREPEAPYLAASRGIGEISFTDQREIKIQRDMRSDHASLTVNPPLLVPSYLAGGRVDVRPGRQFVRRMTGGAAGGIEWMKPPGDPRSSVEVENAALAGMNRRWHRGEEVDPDVKLTMRQLMVDDFFMALREARQRTFQLVQQYAPEEIKGSVGGRPLRTTRAELQGQVSVDMEFDIADLDLELVGKKLKLLNEGLRPLDTEGLLPVSEILMVAARALLPNWAGLMDREPGEVATEEREEELGVINSLLNGQEREYVPGKNHGLRLQVLQQAVQAPRVQRILQEDEDVAALVENRMKFHKHQVDQQQINPQVGRLGVKNLQGGGPH